MRHIPSSRERVQSATMADTDLAGNGSVGSNAPIAEGNQPEVSNGGDTIVEDPGEVVHDERGAERAQRLVVDRHRDSPGGACR